MKKKLKQIILQIQFLPQTTVSFFFRMDSSIKCPIAGFSIFGPWNVWIGTSRASCLPEFCWNGRLGREGRCREGANSIASFFLPSFSGPHVELCHQSQRSKTVEATILAFIYLCRTAWRHPPRRYSSQGLWADERTRLTLVFWFYNVSYL
jgi:hypothetical protein